MRFCPTTPCVRFFEDKKIMVDGSLFNSLVGRMKNRQVHCLSLQFWEDGTLLVKESKIPRTTLLKNFWVFQSSQASGGGERGGGGARGANLLPLDKSRNVICDKISWTLSGWSPPPISYWWPDWHLHVGILIPSVGFCRKWRPQMEVFLFTDPKKREQWSRALESQLSEAECDVTWIKQVCNEMYNVLFMVKKYIHIYDT